MGVGTGSLARDDNSRDYQVITLNFPNPGAVAPEIEKALNDLLKEFEDKYKSRLADKKPILVHLS
jgi:hypothetical protein